MDDDDNNNKDDNNDEQIAKDKRGQSCGLSHQHFDWERRHLALVSAEVSLVMMMMSYGMYDDDDDVLWHV